MCVIETMKIIVMNEEREVPKGISLFELSRAYQDQFAYPIVIAKVNDSFLELHEQIMEPSDVTFFDLTSRIGNRIYVSGLTFLNLFAVKQLFGSQADITVQHSIDKGIYIETNFELTEEKLKALEQKMREIVEQDLEFAKVNVARLDAIDYFMKMNDPVKAGIIKYNTNTYITLYRLGNMYNYFYNYMPHDTKALSHFELTFLGPSGYVLRFPTVYQHDEIKEYTHHPHMFEVFQECRNWAKVMKIQNVVDLNHVVSNGHIEDLIRIDETLQSQRLLQVARQIYEKKDTIKVILLAGPSSSGKTTTTNKLCMYLRSFGLNPKMLSMDDYFVERQETPIDEDGDYDYESPAALDLELFNDQVERILKNEEVTVPTYNFLLGTKQYKRKVQLGQEDILLIEGIHGLNSSILTNIPREKKCKIYLSALTELNIDHHNRISTTDNRLLRRIIRDNRTRGYNVATTLENWPNVREGEEEYIFPYQDDADFTINTALIYELGVLKTYVEPLLYSVEPSSVHYEEAKRLINFLRVFLPIPSESIPQDSILREFIGGSCFHD